MCRRAWNSLNADEMALLENAISDRLAKEINPAEDFFNSYVRDALFSGSVRQFSGPHSDWCLVWVNSGGKLR